MKTISRYLIFIASLFMLGYSCKSSNDAGTVTDIDGNIYKTIQIGDQVWMAENLKVSHFRNGEPIAHAKSKIEWARYGEGIFTIFPQWASPGFDSSNEKIHGKLYNWHAVNDARGLAPEGWHIPTKEEWEQLANYLGKDGGNKLKSTTDWTATKYELSPGSNKTGFNAYPSGGLSGVGSFGAFTTKCYFWSSTKAGNTNGWHFFLSSSGGSLTKATESMVSGNSVRCIKN